jgi:luciferase family oxidoreductase group 1
MTALSVLDLSPLIGGMTAAEAVRETVAMVQIAEDLGFSRFWVAEHHSIKAFGGSAPEILIAAMTQVTKRIRLGSGGVMLPNYSPLKVAEQFLVLEALAPGRIDLGIGRALGADQRTGAALRSAGSDAFPQYFALLNAWLLDSSGKEPFPDRHPAKGIFAQPRGPSHPDLFLLCTSVDSAIFAGRAGVGMVFAEFIAQTDAKPAIEAYRVAFTPSPFRDQPWAGVGTSAFAADTPQEAARLDAPRKVWAMAFLEGRQETFPSLDEAESVLARLGDDPRLGDIMRRSIVGDGETVRKALADKAAHTGADELFVITYGPTRADRARSLALIKG